MRTVAVVVALTGLAACGGTASSVSASPAPGSGRPTTDAPLTPTGSPSTAGDGSTSSTVTLPPSPTDADVTRSPTAGPGVRCDEFVDIGPLAPAPRFHEKVSAVPVILTETRRPEQWAQVQALLESVSQAAGGPSPVRFDYYAGRTYQGYQPRDFLLEDTDGYVRWMLLFADRRTFTDPDHSLAVLFRNRPGPLEYRVVPASIPEVVRRYDLSHSDNRGRPTMPSACDFAARAGDDLVYGN
ncbi:MAG: hypothetical protein HY830_06805 [Actinobacteria bacterium]|nr:hypothetical protein [Actinomycetota bacterium]